MGRLMIVKYTDTHDMERLDTHLNKCSIQHVIFDDGMFTDDSHDYKIYIAQSGHTWQDVLREVNKVKAVKVRYKNNAYIDKEEVYVIC